MRGKRSSALGGSARHRQRDAQAALGKLLEAAVARADDDRPAQPGGASGEVDDTRAYAPPHGAAGQGTCRGRVPSGWTRSGPAKSITPPWKASALEAESQPSADQTQCTMTG